MSLSGSSWIFLLVAAVEIVRSSSLTGDHVCSRVENYTVTSYETYTEPVVVNTFTWCLQIPPRCPKTWTELRQRYRIKTEVKSRTIQECCEGYKMLIHDDADTNATCLPVCKKCLAGVCVAPDECQCNFGYHGNDCAHECPSGLWGPQCMEVCNCGESGDCDPVNGVCRCPPGLQGPQCKEPCAVGRWGPDCAKKCACQSQDNNCDAVTGSCTDNDAFSVRGTSLTYSPSSTTEPVQTIDYAEYTEVAAAPRETTARQTEDLNGSWNETTHVPKTTSPTTNSIALPPQRTATTANETRARGTSTTVRPVIVVVSVPEHRRDEKDRQKFATKDALLRHVQSDENVVPNVDYVKTIHKDDIQATTSIPLDIALIVVAAIVSLGLTSLAVVMILHMRSKLFETVRLAIYDDQEKTKTQESANGKRMSTVVNTSLPPPPVGASPIFTVNAEPETILTVDGIESLNTYANGAAMIGLRISGNLRDLLQDGHYDRPSATLIRLQTNFDHNTEHVYDEIPLQITPPSNRKDL